MSKREFLMLAHELTDKDSVAGWWASEKLDGNRALWDGGASRGLLAAEVPYANTAKDARLLTPPVSTGLFSRYGKVIRAPDWWLDRLPVGVVVDMELWMGRKTFQALCSTIKEHVPGPGWNDVVGFALDIPSWWQLLEDGEINNANWRTKVDRSRCIEWLKGRSVDARPTNAMMPDEAYDSLAKLLGDPVDPPEEPDDRVLVPLKQHRLPPTEPAAREKLRDMLDARTDAEGLVLRHPSRPWYPKRVKWCLKAKPIHDMEGTVVGYTWGRETDKGSRLLGKMGALVLRLDSGVRLELSGFTDREREVTGPSVDYVDHEISYVDDSTRERVRTIVTIPREALSSAGKDASDSWSPVHFPKGSKVTFTYRELSDDGVPKEARYLRKRDD